MRMLAIIFTSALLLLGSTCFLFAAEEPAIVGNWQGILQVGPTALHLVVHITRGADGTLSATLDSPDQGALGIPVSNTTFTGGTLTLTIAAIDGSYRGRSPLTARA